METTEVVKKIADGLCYLHMIELDAFMEIYTICGKACRPLSP